MPHYVGLRIAMQQQQRETISLFDKMDSCPTGIDLSLLKAIEHTYAPNRQTRMASFLSSSNSAPVETHTPSGYGRKQAFLVWGRGRVAPLAFSLALLFGYPAALCCPGLGWLCFYLCSLCP